jgi:hypothetical protein
LFVLFLCRDIWLGKPRLKIEKVLKAFDVGIDILIVQYDAFQAAEKSKDLRAAKTPIGGQG